MEEPILTDEDIENVTDLVEGFRLMERYHVPTSGCKKIVDIKERLSLHLKQQTGQSDTPESFAEAVQEILAKHHGKCRILISVLKAILGELGCVDEQVYQHLRNEGTLLESPESDLQSKVDDLSKEESYILVTGDTTVDTTNIINLMLGSDLLTQIPEKSVICKIRYGAQFQIKVKVEESNVHEKTWSSDKDFEKEASDFISTFCKEDRECSEVKCVELFAPLPSLQTGLGVIHYPAFGESQASDQSPAPSHNAPDGMDVYALIYVSGASANVAYSSNVQNILNALGQNRTMLQMPHCDPSTLLLVCTDENFAEVDSKERLRDKLYYELSRLRSNFQQSQIVTLSYNEASRARRLGYITDDLSHLLNGITRLLPGNLHKKTEHVYWWAETLLSRCLHHVAAYLTRTRVSADELQARQEAAKERLHKIETGSEEIMDRLEKQLNEYIKTITSELSSYLKSEEAQCKMGAWQLQQLPFACAQDLWREIEVKIDCIIETRLLNIMCEWDTRKQFILAAQRDLFCHFKKEFLVIENQLETIDHILESHCWSFADNAVDEMVEFSSWVDSPGNSGKIQFKVSTLQKLATAISSVIGAPLSFNMDLTQWRKRSDALRQLKTYIEDPVSFVHFRSMAVLEKVADICVVQKYVASQLEPVRDHLNMMRASIPKIIQSHRDLIDSIAKDKRTREELEANYLGLEKEIPNLQESLASFGNKHVRCYDFTKENIEVISPEKSFLGRTIKVVGLWSEVTKALFTENTATHEKKPVSLKIYIKRVSCLHLQREEANLRRCKHPQIVRFVATFEAERGVPGFILEPHLVKARRQLFGFKVLPKTSQGRGFHLERCRQFLEQVGIGLEYMHYKGLVHMELSLDSIMMLANKDEVKLINIGEPRLADLPQGMEERAGDFVHLAPEVLNGNMYKSYSDIYSLGLVAWELCNQEKVHKTERNQPLNDFIKKLNAGQISVPSGTGNALDDLVQSCFCEADKRISSTAWVNEIREMSFKTDQVDDES